jgi:hypothetical protein
MKVFTVTLPGRIKDLDYEACVWLLNKWGIDVTDAPRVQEKGDRRHGLYAWKKQDEAERFAQELRFHTRNKLWQVHAFRTDELSHGPLVPVQIQISHEMDGCTYGLHPNSKMLIKKRFPHARLVPSVYIGSDTRANFAPDHQELIWNYVALILTGLNEDQLNELGGYWVFDPEKEEVVRAPESYTHPATANP